MAQAQLEQNGFFKYILLNEEGDLQIKVIRRNGEQLILLSNKKQRLTLTPTQWDIIKSSLPSVDLSLTLV